MCVTALSHSFLNERSVAMATFRKRGPYQWQAQVRKKSQPLQTRTFETRAEAEQWALLIEVEMDKGVLVSRAEEESTPLRELLERYAPCPAACMVRSSPASPPRLSSAPTSVRCAGPASRTSGYMTCATRPPPDCSRRVSISWRSPRSPATRICGCCAVTRI